MKSNKKISTVKGGEIATIIGAGAAAGIAIYKGVKKLITVLSRRETEVTFGNNPFKQN